MYKMFTKFILFFGLLALSKSSDIKKMEEEGVVPDVLTKVPADILQVTYANNKQVDLGHELTPTQVKDQPEVKWKGDKNAFYTLAMVDPDAPSRDAPTLREVNHWLVTNIPASNLASGEVITAYLGSGPPKGTSLHRYVTLLYKQPKKLSFDEPKTGPLSRKHRLNFSIKKFAEKYGLGEPLAGNFFKAQWDPYVDERAKKITN